MMGAAGVRVDVIRHQWAFLEQFDEPVHEDTYLGSKASIVRIDGRDRHRSRTPAGQDFDKCAGFEIRRQYEAGSLNHTGAISTAHDTDVNVA
jgi:hypothetical protein